jgi:hypothetical protein
VGALALPAVGGADEDQLVAGHERQQRVVDRGPGGRSAPRRRPGARRPGRPPPRRPSAAPRRSPAPPRPAHRRRRSVGRSLRRWPSASSPSAVLPHSWRRLHRGPRMRARRALTRQEIVLRPCSGCLWNLAQSAATVRPPRSVTCEGGATTAGATALRGRPRRRRRRRGRPVGQGSEGDQAGTPSRQDPTSRPSLPQENNMNMRAAQRVKRVECRLSDYACDSTHKSLTKRESDAYRSPHSRWAT